MKLAALLLILANGLNAESGTFVIHMILHAIGEEHYEISAAQGGLVLETTNEYSDRGNTRTASATLRMMAGYTAESLEMKGKPASASGGPGPGFTLQGASPFALPMAIL